MKYKKVAGHTKKKKAARSDPPKKPTKKRDVPAGLKPRLIFAEEMLQGHKYVHPMLRSVVVFEGRYKNDDMTIKAYDLLGEIVTWHAKRHSPIRVDDAAVPRMMQEHQRRFALLFRKINPRSRVVTDVDGEGKAVDLKEATKRKLGRRGPVNEKTGYGEGTDGNRFAEIILKHGTDAKKRPLCIQDIEKLLRERFDKKKARALAQSWYSTVKRKNPSWWS